MVQRIKLSGKHAIGEHMYTVVDDDWFVELRRYKWKAKPNGNGTHVYAVRSLGVGDGKTITVRMHRVILGYTGQLDIDHIDQNPLNNQRINLRVATRSQNQLNRRATDVRLQCAQCSLVAVRRTKVGNESRMKYCSELCAQIANKPEPPEPAAPRSPIRFRSCTVCASRFVASYDSAQYCSERCRVRAKRANMKADGRLAALYAKQALYSRERRARLKGQPAP